MANPVGKELVAVIGVTGTGGLSGVSEYFTTQQIANLGGGGTTRIISTGSSDTASSSDSAVFWNSATASAKTESIPAPTTLGEKLTIADDYGNAATYNITITPTSGTIDGASTYVISVNWGSVSLIADGSSNWKTV